MPTTAQKEAILRKAGIAVPPCPLSGITNREPTVQQQQQAQPEEGDAAQLGAGLRHEADTQAAQAWARDVDALYSHYVIARAARSLQEDDASRPGSHA